MHIVSLSLYPVLLYHSYSFCSLVWGVASELWGKGWSTSSISFTETWFSYANVFCCCVFFFSLCVNAPSGVSATITDSGHWEKALQRVPLLAIVTEEKDGN